MPRRISDLFHNELAQQAVLAREKTSLVVEIVIVVAPVVALVVRRRVAVFVCPTCSPERCCVCIRIVVFMCPHCSPERCWTQLCMCTFGLHSLLSRAMLCTSDTVYNIRAAAQWLDVFPAAFISKQTSPICTLFRSLFSRS